MDMLMDMDTDLPSDMAMDTVTNLKKRRSAGDAAKTIKDGIN